MTPESRPELAGLAIFVINGDGTSIHCTPQNAAGGGINVSAAGPATVAGTRGQRAVHAGRPGPHRGPHRRPVPRERPAGAPAGTGLVVTIAVITGAIATIIGTAVTICAWAGWAP